jgi:hypothetical protein
MHFRFREKSGHAAEISATTEFDPNRPSVGYPKRTAAAFFGQHFSGAHKSPKLWGLDLVEHGPFRAPV